MRQSVGGVLKALNNFKRTGFALGCENWDRYNGETSGCSRSCPLNGIFTSSACVCGCVVNSMSATTAT